MRKPFAIGSLVKRKFPSDRPQFCLVVDRFLLSKKSVSIPQYWFDASGWQNLQNFPFPDEGKWLFLILGNSVEIIHEDWLIKS